MRITTKRFLAGVVAAAAILGAGAGTAMATTAAPSADASASVGGTLDVAVKTGVVVDLKGRSDLTVKLTSGASVRVTVGELTRVTGVLKAGVQVAVVGVEVDGKVLASLVTCG
jgi:hypothetical protein